ncbi:MAG: outer membrane beta-barrel protein [Bacteroidales bacterium]|nr:outer membrane beta-barrel protein [Bacteroidales bacterium]
MKRALLILSLLLSAATALRAQDADTLRVKPVTIGLIVQANFAGEHMYIAESSLSAYPGFGAEAGAALEYHMTRYLSVEFQLLLALQNGSYFAANQDPGFLIWHRRNVSYIADMRLWGMDIPLYLVGRLPVGSGDLRLGAGPFTHLTFDAWCPGDRDFITPYKRIISKDDATGDKHYALSDSHAGFGLLLGYEFPSGLQLNLSAKYSITDILNYESDYSHAHPYKVSLGAGWRF